MLLNYSIFGLSAHNTQRTVIHVQTACRLYISMVGMCMCLGILEIYKHNNVCINK